MVRPEPLLLTIPLPPALDVYSYDEDDMVLDPNLAEHLSHFGIDMLKMQKVRPLQLQILLVPAHQALPRLRLKQRVGASCHGYPGPRHMWASFGKVSRIHYSFIDHY